MKLLISFQLRAHITDIVVDQMPILGEMKGYLERLSFMDPPATGGNTLLLEQVSSFSPQSTGLKQQYKPQGGVPRMEERGRIKTLRHTVANSGKARR